MSNETTPAVDWDTYEPTAAVRKAAIVLFSADAVDAMCFGWVPQAHEALTAALDVEEMAAVIWTASRADEGTISATGAKHVAAALRAALLGGVS